MSSSRNQSTIPNHMKLLLPHLTPNTSNNPSSKSQCYTIKLTDAQLEKFLSSPSSEIIYQTSTTGVIILPGPSSNSNAASLKFTTRETGDGNDSARAFLFSRRAQTKQARYVGVIAADMELDPATGANGSRGASMRSKKRPDEGRKEVRKLEIMEFDQVGPPVKKQRKRAAPEKRPRVIRSRPAVGRPGSSSGANANVMQGRKEGVGVNACSPALSSPARLSQAVKRPNGGTSFGGLSSRRISPGRRMSPGLGGMVQPMRNGSGGSGSSGSAGMGGNSPSSPRVGNLRGGLGDMRTSVIHIVGIGGGQLQSIRGRVMGNEARAEMMDRFNEVLEEVGSKVNGVWVLKKELWAEVEDGYEKYTEVERTKMRIEREKAMNRGGDVKLTEGQKVIDGGLKEFEEERKGLEFVSRSVRSKDDEMKFRRRFQKWYPLYDAVIAELEGMGERFKHLDGQMREARHGQEREIVSKRIVTNYNRYRKRREFLVEVLPKLHESLMDIRNALEVYSKQFSRPLTSSSLSMPSKR